MKIVLLGSGNVATHLGKALQQSGNEIVQVWSYNHLHAEELAAQIGAEPISPGNGFISTAAEIYIISVKDDAIAETANRIPGNNQLIVHTAGSVDLNILAEKSNKIGVLYPIQTFSKQKEVDFKQVPIAIEGVDPKTLSTISDLAKGISDKVLQLDSASRMALHIAAVLACNFTNHLYALAEDLLNRQNIDFSLIHPLIAETAMKAQLVSPRIAQTGPAIRGDQKTMEKHLEFLKSQPPLQELYATLSQSIISLNLE